MRFAAQRDFKPQTDEPVVLIELGFLEPSGAEDHSAERAHLHAGAPGAVGDVVTPLVLMGNFLRGSAALTATGDAGVPLLTGLAAGTIYANVHTAMYPMGEIRGQVRVVPAPSSP